MIDTPRTDDLIHRVQSQIMPFSDGFYHLIKLTRELEREVCVLKGSKGLQRLESRGAAKESGRS